MEKTPSYRFIMVQIWYVPVIFKLHCFGSKAIASVAQQVEIFSVEELNL